MSTPRELLDRLDSRHDELIHKLDALNAQIEQALAEFGKTRATPQSESLSLESPSEEFSQRRAA